jgi:3-phenylpropionate/trans-cinnamate dioxygenase ferredoxin reductase component
MTQIEGITLEEGTLIVGTGQAGFQLAGFLRDEGYAARIRIVGDEVDLPYQRPPLSKAYINGECDAAQLTFQSRDWYGKRNIELVLGTRIHRIDREHQYAEAVGGARFSYSRLVFASGARNRHLPSVDSSLSAVINLRTLADASAIRDKLMDVRDVVVIGGGFLGLEFAAVAAARGIRVTVVEALTTLMGGRAVSAQVSDVVRRYHESLGVSFLFGTSIRTLHELHGGRLDMATHDGHRLQADLALVSVGVIANEELAHQAGLKTNAGIVVDEFLSTSEPTIAAIGDCVLLKSRFSSDDFCRIESVQNAVDQARCLAKTLTGQPTAYDAVPWFWSDQGGLKLQIAGISAGTDTTVIRGNPTERRMSAYCFRSGRLIAVESVARPGDHMIARRLLSAGTHVTPAHVKDESLDLKSLLAPRAPKPDAQPTDETLRSSRLIASGVDNPERV